MPPNVSWIGPNTDVYVIYKFLKQERRFCLEEQKTLVDMLRRSPTNTRLVAQLEFVKIQATALLRNQKQMGYIVFVQERRRDEYCEDLIDLGWMRERRLDELDLHSYVYGIWSS